jgi:hypothetical protein
LVPIGSMIIQEHALHLFPPERLINDTDICQCVFRQQIDTMNPNWVTKGVWLYIAISWAFVF